MRAEQNQKNTPKGAIVILTITLVVSAAGIYLQQRSAPEAVHLVVKVSNATSNASISHAQVRVMIPEGGDVVALSDDNGMASLTLPAIRSGHGTTQMAVVADGFIENRALDENLDKHASFPA
jgi:hypothetical protein